MPTRRSGTLAALVLTALLMCAMPGLWQSLQPADTNRMHPSLRPPQMRTLSVWLLSTEVPDGRLIRQLCSAFEKEQRGVRIFLRTVTLDELMAPEAVLPDAVLLATGSLPLAREVLLPLEGMETDDASGMSAGRRYALPLWCVPTVLCVPDEWAQEDIPWEHLQEPGALQLPSGIALQQLMLAAPQAETLSRLADTPLQERFARVETAARHASCGEDRAAFELPAVSGLARYAALCKDSPDARAFLMFLSAHSLLSAEHHLAQTENIYLPNAFAHTSQEISSLCRDAFDRLEDPALTLLRLR